MKKRGFQQTHLIENDAKSGPPFTVGETRGIAMFGCVAGDIQAWLNERGGTNPEASESNYQAARKD